VKRILITGRGSYIGTSFENYIKTHFAQTYSVDSLDMIDGSWRKADFSSYDAIFHVAGIAHQKETKENAPLYYAVNRDLAIEVATKAKKEGVLQFVFLSSMSVYGMEVGTIKKNTKPDPKSHYGRSKWQAEQGIVALRDENFRVTVIRPPMVYGEGCKGNYNALVSLAKKLPFCPTYRNQRSLIEIGNLCKFVCYAIENEADGLFRIQNKAYNCTSDMIYELGVSFGRKWKRSGILNGGIAIFARMTTTGKKAFGNLLYTELEDYEKI
jgi:UDP-glucose 4-epimerase